MSIRASDGELGKIKDAYFDDHRWAARYSLRETGRGAPEYDPGADYSRTRPACTSTTTGSGYWR